MRIHRTLLLAVLLAGCEDETITPDEPPPNQPPAVSAAIPDQRLSGPGVATTLDVSGHFTDPDGDALTFAAASSDTAVVTVSMAGSEVTLTGGVVGGAGRVTVTARDPGGAEAAVMFGVVVNRPPVAPDSIPAQTLWHEATRVDVDLTGAFSDPDGDALTYTAASSDTTIVPVALHPAAVVSLGGPLQGEATVMVTARDPDGLEAQASFPVAVVANPDRTTLMALADSFFSVNPSWYEMNWQPGVPLTDWHGIDVNSAGRVSCLGGNCNWTSDEDGPLEQLGLVGSLPTDLGQLEALQVLVLTVGVGPIPHQLWGALPNLETLGLHGWITGSIPQQLENLHALKHLHLSGWHLSGPIPSGLQRLSDLESLSIGTFSRRVRRSYPSGGETDVCVASDSLGRWLIDSMGWEPEWVRPCVGSAHLIQVVQTRNATVPLVAERPAALRLFDIPPPARARFFLDGTETHVVNVHEVAFDAAGGREIAFGDIIAPAAIIPRSVVQPGLEMVVEWKQGRFPEEGRQRIEVARLPPLELTLIPLVFSNPDPDGRHEGFVNGVDRAASGYSRSGFRLLPAHGCRIPPCSPGSYGVEAKTHPIIGVIETTGKRVHDPGNFLSAVAVARRLEGGTGYWMGIVEGGGSGGLAFVGGNVAWATPGAIQHELGHNLGLRHPPNSPGIVRNRRGLACDVATTFDSSYPHPNGQIGAWGYNLGYPRFVPPNTPDLMTYCDPFGSISEPFPGYGVWISDYHYKKALSHRQREHQRSTTTAAAPVRSLLLWGGTDAEKGPHLGPAFVVDAPPSPPEQPGPWTIKGRDASGQTLFSLPFAMPEIADGGEGAGGFAYTLPVRSGWDTLASITLSGPDGTATLDESTDRPMSIWRDRDGKVRAILHGDPVQADGVTSGLADVPLDVVTSRGIPSTADWRH
ncbi:MAG: hypothetical protein F4205_16285 [Gemmatimonadetes bacterium]|nr:hypothetical protein [Gemmatimonadota bacterium]